MSMRVIRGLLVVLAIVLLLAGVAVAGLFTTIGQHAVRDGITSWTTEKLGRAVRIGDVRLQLGRNIQISATDVHLANVAWGSRADMLVAARLGIELDAQSLLSRSPTVIVNEIRVDGLDVLLERNTDGDANWEFEVPPREPGSPWLSTLPIVVDRVALPGAHFQFIGPRLDRPLDVRFDEINQQRGTGDMLDFTASGRANDTDLELNGQVGPFANLVAAKAFSASLDAKVGELSLSVKARVDNLARPIDSEAHVELNGPDAAYVTSTLGVRNLGNGPFNLSLSVSPAPDGTGVRGSVVGRIGEFDISGDGELSEPTDMGRLTFRTEVTGPDVSLLAGIVGFDLLPPERFHLVAAIRRTGELVQIDQADLELPDSALSVRGSVKRIDKIAGNDLTIHITGASLEKFRRLLHVPGIATGPFDITGTMHPADSGEDMLDLTATTTLANVSASGPLGDFPGYFGTRLKFTVGGANFAPFAKQVGLIAGSRAAFTGQGQFEWTPSGVVLHATSLKVGDDTLNLDGPIGKSPAFESAVRFGLQGKSLASIAGYAGWSGLPPRPYKIAGQLQRQNGRTRLDGVDIAAAGTRLQLSGTLGTPKQDAALTFTFDGSDLEPFSALAPGIMLPRGPFRAQGGISYGVDRLRLENVSAAIAGSEGVVTADVALPLGTSVGTRPNQFEVRANGPDLKLLVPDAPESAAARQKFDLHAKGSWDRDKWFFDTLLFDTPGGFLSVQGKLDRAPDYSTTAMKISARTANLGETGRLFDIDLPAQPLDFTAMISGTPDTFRMQQLSGHFGKSDFSGSIGLDLKAKPNLDIHLRSSVLDLTPLTDAVAGSGAAPARVPLSTRAIPNVELPIALLNRVNGQAEIQSAQTSFFGQMYDNLELRGTLQDGQLTVDPIAFGSADGNMAAQLSIGPDLRSPNVRLVADGNDVRLGVIPGMGRTTAAASRYKVQIDVAATGLNLRDLLRTLDGKIRFVGEGGRIPNSRLNALSSDFVSELVRTLNPLSKRQEFTDVVCQAYLFDADNGMLRTDPVIVVRTADIDVVSTGSIDLRNEAIDFNFKTAARGGLGFSAGELLNAYVKVSGTLSKPYLTVDAKGTLVNGGAAFATGGLSILATTLWDRLSRQKDPCAAAVAEAGRRSAAKKSWW
jgi:uncharacterized protein involved in outer membrane biogenesis